MNMAKMKWVCELFADNLFLSIRNPKETNWKFLSLTKKKFSKTATVYAEKKKTYGVPWTVWGGPRWFHNGSVMHWKLMSWGTDECLWCQAPSEMQGWEKFCVKDVKYFFISHMERTVFQCLSTYNLIPWN